MVTSARIIRSFAPGAKVLTCSLLLSLLWPHGAVCQSSAVGVVEQAHYAAERGTPYLLRLNTEFPVHKDDASTVIRAHFALNSDDDLAFKHEVGFQNDIAIDRYQRHYRGIPVEHGHYAVLTKSGQIQSVHAEHYILDEVSTVATLTESQALQSALDALGSSLYAWEATQNILDQARDLPAPVRQALIDAQEQEYPSGTLVIVKDFFSEELVIDLAYKFVIESVEPFFKDRVYVNAHDGRVMLRDPQIKHGTGETRYSGERSFPTSLYNTIGSDTFQLRGIDSISGVLCETRSVDGFGGLPLSIAAVYALSTPILDGDQGDPCLTDGITTVAETGDDQWLKEEHYKAIFDTLPPPDVSCCVTYTPHPGTCNEIQNDDLALDAQWGAAIVAQYWQVRHGRNSFDDLGADIISFVHYGDAYNNAFWNGTFMTYGDGNSQKDVSDPANGDFGPFTSLDICAHEIGHAICSHTSDLVYQKESGAMNEALSDIWAAAIERFVLDSIDPTLPYDPYGIGEQIDDRDNGLPPGHPDAYAIRWMDDPKACINPDTYNGTFYFPTEPPICPVPNLATDYCGVHLNSGVINKWFYLLNVGSGQALSPGRCLGGSKAAFDDEVNDFGEAYEVFGIGADKAEAITFLTETLLTPNALFAHMRAASIEAARALHGICSFEEIQTTNAWHAVGVGDTFATCTPKIEFGGFNPAAVSERSDSSGCEAIVTVGLTMHSYMASQTVQFVTSGTATRGTDYDLTSDSLTFNGDETKTLFLTIYDDKKIEPDPDTIVIWFNDGGFTDTAMLVIEDDDVIPAVGDSVTLLSEAFSSDSIPDGWQQFAVNIESTNHWEFNGAGLVAGKAYVAPPGSPTAAYDLTAFSNVRLVSPMLDARGRSNVLISFDWRAGGEADAVEPTVIFDYGTFQLSEDGIAWTDIENYVGTQGGNVPDSGTYQLMHPELDNQTFFLGFRWYNDGLVGSGFSFSIDNVVVTAEDMDIESDTGDRMEAEVPPSDTIAFVSDNDNELIGLIHGAQSDLGCTELRIDANQPMTDKLPSMCGERSSKVIGLLSPNTSDSLTLTLFFRASELDEWTDPASLNILAVNSADIDDLSNGHRVIPNTEIAVVDATDGGDGYISYAFTTTGSSKTYALTDRTPHPKTYFVKNASDNNPNSLRQQIIKACPLDTIRFENQLVGDTIRLTGPQITIDKPLVIIGLGTDDLVISGENNGRVFYIPPTVQVYMQDLTCVNGEAAGDGDAILNEGALLLKNVSLKEN